MEELREKAAENTALIFSVFLNHMQNKKNDVGLGLPGLNSKGHLSFSVHFSPFQRAV